MATKKVYETSVITLHEKVFNSSNGTATKWQIEHGDTLVDRSGGDILIIPFHSVEYGTIVENTEEVDMTDNFCADGGASSYVQIGGVKYPITADIAGCVEGEGTYFPIFRIDGAMLENGLYYTLYYSGQMDGDSAECDEGTAQFNESTWITNTRDGVELVFGDTEVATCEEATELAVEVLDANTIVVKETADPIPTPGPSPK